MQHLADSIQIDASPEQVFDFVTDPKRAPEWIPSMVSVSNVKGSGQGMTYEWVFKMAGFHLEGRTEVTRFAENKAFEHTSKGAIKSTWRYHLSKEDGGTNVRLEIDYEIPTKVGQKLAEKILLRQHKRELDTALNALKELVEYRSRGGQVAE